MGLDRIEAKEIRGRILKIIHINYPREVSDRVIALTLNDIRMVVSSGVLAGHFSYLEEKGYVELEEMHSQPLGLTMTMVRLTAKGKDLLEGNIDSDPGVRI